MLHISAVARVWLSTKDEVDRFVVPGSASAPLVILNFDRYKY